MEKHCTRGYYSLRRNRLNKEGKLPIQVTIATNGERICFVTGKFCSITNWNVNRELFSIHKLHRLASYNNRILWIIGTE